MTRKHFNKLAEILRQHCMADRGKPTQCRHTHALVLDIAKMCRAENPRFDKDKFIEAVTKDL